MQTHWLSRARDKAVTVTYRQTLPISYPETYNNSLEHWLRKYMIAINVSK
jgi:hypothetical protein